MNRSRLFRRVLVAVALVAAVAYAAALVWLISQETRLVFRAPSRLGDARPAFDYSQVTLPREDRLEQFAWIMRPDPPAAPTTWLLYLHGNAATVATRTNIARYRELRAMGMNILAPEYRGFAGLDGTPTESSLDKDARAGYEYLRRDLKVAPERIVIFGWSLGAAVAVNLASQVDSSAVILEGAPASLVAVGQQRYPIFPIRLVMRNPFESVLKVGRVKSPMLFLHSPEDVVIPIAEGRRLFDAVKADKTFVEVRGGHVYAAEKDGDAYWSAVRSFLEKRGLIEVTRPRALPEIQS